METFHLQSDYRPTAEQKRAVERLTRNFENNQKYQVLLGVTGSGKTFVMANLIEKLQIPTLIISHNKTLAGQLYQEMRDFFPENAVSFFISYYDYYQPEAYLPATDTYIEKDSAINDLIDQLRLETTANILSRHDTVVVASVSCIYNLGSPQIYRQFAFNLEKGEKILSREIIDKLIGLQYERNEFDFKRGTFRLRGEHLDIYPANDEKAIRLYLTDKIEKIELFNPLTGELINPKDEEIKAVSLFPAKHFVTDPEQNSPALIQIKKEAEERAKFFERRKDFLSAQRIRQRVNYDLEMIREFGYVKGIENYSRYFDGRKSGEPPFTLLDYFQYAYNQKWLVIVDESHITFPQIKGMANGDQSRKQTLIDYGFRLPSALDNRPLKFNEFLVKIPNFIAASATPDNWEIKRALESGQENLVELLTRPTGIPDPEVEIRPTQNQVQDVVKEIKKRAQRKERVLVTTLTKLMAEDLANYLQEQNLKVHYLHSEIKTLERAEILENLRRGKYDVLVGINLLREGLDLPEVSLVAILDADKEGFLRSETTLIQTMGRAARHIQGRVILYADNITGSIERALAEVKRRRNYQLMINRKYGIIPQTIQKPIRKRLVEEKEDNLVSQLTASGTVFPKIKEVQPESLTPLDKKQLVKKLKKEMREAADNLDFELAIEIRDKIKDLEK